MIKNIKYFIDKEFSDHYRNSGPLLVEFMKYYYEWLSLVDNPYNSTNKFLDNIDVDTANEDFILFMRKEFMQNIPVNILVDERLLIKNIIDFYKSKGSESSYKLLFRILFNEEIQFYYPGRDILRVSDGKWFVEKKLLIDRFDVQNIEDITVIKGSISGATAKIEKYIETLEMNSVTKNLYISAIFGNFISGETIIDELTNNFLCQTLSGVITLPGKSLNNDGFISSDKYIQDNFYYQEYSYEIQSSKSLNEYSDVVKKLVHPAGTKMFGKVVADYSATLNTQDINSTVHLEQFGLIQNYIIDYQSNINVSLLKTIPNEYDIFQYSNVHLLDEKYTITDGTGTIRLNASGNTVNALGAFTVNDLGLQTIEDIGSRKILEGTGTNFVSQISPGNFLLINDTTNNVQSIVQVQRIIDSDTLKITENYPFDSFVATNYKLYYNGTILPPTWAGTLTWRDDLSWNDTANWADGNTNWAGTLTWRDDLLWNDLASWQDS